LDHYTLVKKGDFCYNKSYSNGYDWGATKRLNDFEKAVVTTLYICFRLKDENKNSGDFFEYYFESGILYKGLSKVANEGGRAHGLLNVTSSDFFNIKIGVPTFEEQKAIANILNKATQELKQYEQKLETLQLQKKGLMQQLLTGKVRVKS
jgi:type I restriction enzyme S subunit